ncbi:hypothetical protein [Oscillibacter sp. 1-3]|uniref:hypothetical protein n=1 Tax=Oscillibacter sp. 1-3 TaxID=1235797 RepID=UPI00039D4A4B|nr:hypothetical protein [Oscillibacter sp. 1-3]
MNIRKLRISKCFNYIIRDFGFAAAVRKSGRFPHFRHFSTVLSAPVQYLSGDGLHEFLTQSERKIHRQGVRGEIPNRL